MHQKRTEMPKTWPVARKGTKYIAIASHSKRTAIPIVFVLREMLKLGKTRREVRHMVLSKEVMLNQKIIRDIKLPMQISDTLSISRIGKSYRMDIENGKLKLKEIKESEAGKKVEKIIGKKIIGKNIKQINLQDGRNFIVKEDFSIGDSAIIDFKGKKVDKILKLKEGAKIEIIAGKHTGERGILKGEKQLEREKVYTVKVDHKEINLPGKTLKVID